MSALSIFPAFPVFTGLDGQPLDNGFIWIGQPSLDPQTNPAAVYWDEALSIAAPQPIRTLAGYPSRSGTPARIYCDGAFSIRVQDNKGVTVYNDLLISNVNGSPLVIDNGTEQLTIELDGSDFTFNHTQAGDFLTYDDATGDLYFAGVSAGASTAEIAETVNPNGVTTVTILNSAVTTDKINNLAVTTAKIADSNVTTAKIANANITADKIANANITADKLDGAQTGTAPIYGARAWVNFNGTGTVAIRASGNVSSITDNGTGDYTVNFSTAMPDANYGYAISISGSANTLKSSGQGGASAQFSPTTSAVRVFASLSGAGASDCDGVCVTIHR
jgi:hypothetical protein